MFGVVYKFVRNLSLRDPLVAFLLFFAACSDIGERDNPLDPGASNYVATDTTNTDDSGSSSGSHGKASSSSGSNDAKSSAASFSTDEIVCGDMWCGPKGDVRVVTEFEDSDSYGFWFDYNDNNDTDDNGSGTSFFTWPAEWGEDHAWNNIIEYCGGVCGSVTMGGPLAYPFAGIGFDISRSDKVGNDITGWGGLCVAYMSDGIDIAMEIEPVNSKDLTAYDNHKVTLKVRDTIGVVDYPWSKFKQAGWGKTADLNAVLSSAIRVKFQFNGSDGEKSNFKIVSVGRYGTCNEVVNQSSNSGDVINVTSSSSVSSSSQKTTSSSSSEKNSSSTQSSSSFSVEKFLNSKVSYGEITDDRDGKVYKTVQVGDQLWMAQNLNFESENSYCYEDNPKNCDMYGRLYTWATAMDSLGTYGEEGKDCGYKSECSAVLYKGVRGVCPKGFHLPSPTEWNKMMLTIGIDGDEKMMGTIQSAKGGWNSSTGIKASNDYGLSFTNFGSSRSSKGKYGSGLGHVCWTSASKNDYATLIWGMNGDWIGFSEQSKDYANYVRCVGDNPIVKESFIDERDGQEYKTVVIGKQKWMAQNLNYNAEGSKCAYGDDGDCSKIGRLYSWIIAVNTEGCDAESPCDLKYPLQGVCPNGWHLPTMEEYETLVKESYFVNGGEYAGLMLKSLDGWECEECKKGVDALGFSVPVGPTAGGDGEYSFVLNATYWTASEDTYRDAYDFSIMDDARFFPDLKMWEYYIRCVENDK